MNEVFDSNKNTQKQKGIKIDLTKHLNMNNATWSFLYINTRSCKKLRYNSLRIFTRKKNKKKNPKKKIEKIPQEIGRWASKNVAVN